MSDLKTVKDFDKSLDHCQVDWHYHVYDEYTLIRWIDFREEAKKWIKELNGALEEACKKQTDGYYNDVEIEIEGVTYIASAFEDDEAKPIIKFINQFFNLEEEK